MHPRNKGIIAETGVDFFLEINCFLMADMTGLGLEILEFSQNLFLKSYLHNIASNTLTELQPMYVCVCVCVSFSLTWRDPRSRNDAIRLA